jgi:hypothetical protein
MMISALKKNGVVVIIDPMSDREVSDENEAIREIADALIEGDKYRIYGTHGEHLTINDVDFCTVVAEDLTSNLKFANALRKIASYTSISGGIGDVAFTLRNFCKIIDEAVLAQARVIYEEKGE